MFGFRKRRRRRLLAQPFPTAWQSHLDDNVHHFALLTDAEQAKLRDDLRLFIAERRWVGCGGLKLTDEIRVTIAAQACLLTLALDGEPYRRVKEILIYPAAYLIPGRRAGGGMVVREATPVAGTAHYRGPVTLSWADALAGGRNAADGRNVVLHEFAHKLDMIDGLVDGTPPLHARAQYGDWIGAMTEAFGTLRRAAADRRATLLDTYGATNPAEFFAVATECFFEKPEQMQRRHGELYDVLREYYRQDTAARFE